MSTSKWQQNFSTGHPLIDAQHYKLIEMIDYMQHKIDLDDNVQNALLLDSILKFNKHIKKHFNTEESLMKIYSVDIRHCESHIEQHRDFENEISYYMNNFKNGNTKKDIEEMIVFALKWIEFHILTSDFELMSQIDYISTEGYQPSAAFNLINDQCDLNSYQYSNSLKAIYHQQFKRKIMLENEIYNLLKQLKGKDKKINSLKEQLNNAMFLDILTGLPNRRYALEELGKLTHEWKRYGTVFSVLFIDVDNFKSVNDKYGHDYGDMLLQWLSIFLEKNTRKNDIVCRLSGDEFIILCPHTDTSSALKIGQHLNKKCTHSSQNISLYWKPSLSIGVATVSKNYSTPSAILKQADAAMYISKKNGGGITTFNSNQVVNLDG